MKTALCSLPLCIFLLAAEARGRVTAAEDDAASYHSGWSAEGAGTGFGAWVLRTTGGAEGESHAGHFIADATSHSDLGPLAPKGKAFGLYANGVGFESAAAFRPFKKALQSGETFSFLMKSGAIEKKFETDDAGTGSIGLTLRTGNGSESTDNYNSGGRFEFGFYEGQGNYQIYDGEENHDSGVARAEQGVSVTVKLVTEDTYDLEITNLGDKAVTKLAGRKWGGSGAIESFCIFNRDGEKADAFFNGFQVGQE